MNEKPPACEGCVLYEKGQGFIEPSGSPDAQVMLIGEAPGIEEIHHRPVGAPFVGRAGTVLIRALREIGVDRKDVFITNSLRCRPTNPAGTANRFPTIREMDECHKRHTIPEIKRVKPNLIVFLGGKAMQGMTRRSEVMSTPKRPGYWHSILSGDEVRGMERRTHYKKNFVWPESNPKALFTIHPSIIVKPYGKAGRFGLYEAFKHDLKKAFKESWTQVPQRIKVDYWLDPPRISSIEGDTMAFDLETDGSLDHPRITMIGVSSKSGVAQVYPWNDENRSRLSIMLTNPNITKVIHNAAFDEQVLAKHGIVVEGPLWDTMIGANLLYSHMPVGLASVGPQFTDLPQWKQTMEQNVMLYCAMDVDATFRLAEFQQYVLKVRSPMGEKFLEHVKSYVMPARRVFNEMEMGGVRIDKRMQHQLLLDLSTEKRDLEREWNRLAPGVNPRSTPQKRELFFETMEMKVTGRTPITQLPSLAEKPLAKLKKLYPEERLLQILGEIQALGNRTLNVDMPLDANGLYHPTYKMHTSKTGRVSSGEDVADPDKAHGAANNVMGVPQKYRKMYVPEDGNVFMEFDFAGIEFAVDAYLSGDHDAMKMYDSGQDIHAKVASMAYGRPIKEIREEYKHAEATGQSTRDTMRGKGKRIVHGGRYGAQKKKAAEVTGLPEDEAGALLKAYKLLFVRLARWQEERVRLAKSQGWLENAYGRRIWFPDPGAVNEMLAFTPQSTALDIALERLVWIHQARRSERSSNVYWDIRLFNHDSYLVECHFNFHGAIKNAVRAIMERPVPQCNGLVVRADAKVGKNWGEMREI